jgi:hypothetical protein
MGNLDLDPGGLKWPTFEERSDYHVGRLGDEYISMFDQNYSKFVTSNLDPDSPKFLSGIGFNE